MVGRATNASRHPAIRSVTGRRSRFARRIAVAIASLLLVNTLSANEISIARRELAICTAWDVHITTLIEDFGRLNIVGPADLADAAFQQIEARVLCASGRKNEGARLYERIAFPLCEEADCADAIRRE